MTLCLPRCAAGVTRLPCHVAHRCRLRLARAAAGPVAFIRMPNHNPVEEIDPDEPTR